MTIGKVLQWNMGYPHASSVKEENRPSQAIVDSRYEIVEALILDNKPTFVALQEVPPRCADNLKAKLARSYEVVSGKKGLVTLYYSKDWRRKSDMREFALTDDGRALPRAMLLSLQHRVLKVHMRLWNVHFWSRLSDQTVIKSKVEQFVKDHIEDHRVKSKVKATEIIVGDFNLPPYSSVITSKSCLWANASLQSTRAREHDRDPSKKRYRALFNPSWELLGHHEPPLGTYYYDQEEAVDGPWHVFDQLLMSPEHGLLNKRHSTILHQVGQKRLWSDDRIRRPDKTLGSDHYPILVEFLLS